MIRHFGATVGQGRRVARLADHSEQRLASIAAKVENRPCLKVYFEKWDELMISGIHWLSDLKEIAGDEDVFPNNAQQGAAMDRFETSDQVSAEASDVIHASCCGKKERPKKIAARPGWETVPAVREGRIIEIKSLLNLQRGPAALTNGLDAVHVALAPEEETLS